MQRTCIALLVALLLGHAPAAAQDEGGRILPAAAGGVLGIAGGGYVALSIIVAESRAGKYIDNFQEVFGWRSLPVIAGASIGTALGFYNPERLKRAVLFGFGGMAAGAGTGWLLGPVLWEGPEAKWAGAAIGAGAGLAIAYVVGAITASSEEDLTSSNSVVLPVAFRLSVP